MSQFQIVPLRTPLVLAQHTFAAEAGQDVQASFDFLAFHGQDQLWFQRGGCVSSPPQQAGADYSAAIPVSNSLKLDFTGTTYNLLPLQLCLLVAARSPPTFGYTANTVLEFLDVEVHVAGITVMPTSFQVGMSSEIKMAVLGTSLKKVSSIFSFSRSCPALLSSRAPLPLTRGAQPPAHAPRA